MKSRKRSKVVLKTTTPLEKVESGAHEMNKIREST
jgi:hypothetical protein